MAGIQIVGNGGTILEVDAGRNVLNRRGAANYGVLGGAFSVTGGPAGIVAAALAANTPLMTLRHGTAATTNMYITRLRVCISSATIGVSAGVPGQIAWQRFTAATPTGGTARTSARKDLSTGSASQVLDIRDSAAALTVTSVAFGDVLIINPIPNFTTGTSSEFLADLNEDEFIRLTAGDGICLRTQVAGPATMTWTYTYSIHWIEK